MFEMYDEISCSALALTEERQAADRVGDRATSNGL